MTKKHGCTKCHGTGYLTIANVMVDNFGRRMPARRAQNDKYQCGGQEIEFIRMPCERCERKATKAKASVGGMGAG